MSQAVSQRPLPLELVAPGAAFGPVGLLKLTGPDAIPLLQRLSTQDLAPLQETTAAAPAAPCATTALTNAQGKMLDWLWVAARPAQGADGAPSAVLVRTAPGRASVVREWLEKYIVMEDVTVTDVSNSHAAIWVDHPAAGTVCWDSASESNSAAAPQAESDAQLQHLTHGHAGWAYSNDSTVGDVRGVWCRDLSAYGTTSWAGIVAQDDVPVWKQRLDAAGVPEVPADDPRWEVRRVMAGVPSSKYEYAQPVSPLMLRLATNSVSFAKGCYIGQEVISRLDSYDKLARLLMGWRLSDPSPSLVTALRQPDFVANAIKLVDPDTGKTVGRGTSVAVAGAGSPAGAHNPLAVVGLAMVERAAAQPGAAVRVVLSEGDVKDQGESQSATLEARPMWGNET